MGLLGHPALSSKGTLTQLSKQVAAHPAQQTGGTWYFPPLVTWPPEKSAAHSLIWCGNHIPRDTSVGPRDAVWSICPIWGEPAPETEE